MLIDETENKNESLSMVLRDLQKLQEVLLNDTRNLKMNNALTNFKEKGEALIKKILLVQKLFKILHMVEKLYQSTKNSSTSQNVNEFFSLIKNLISRYELHQMKLDKIS